MLRRLDPFRHAVEPAALAGLVAVVGLALFRPALLVSGLVAVILGGRLYYNHGGLGDRWNEANERLAPVVAPKVHLLASGSATGALGATLLALGLPL